MRAFVFLCCTSLVVAACSTEPAGPTPSLPTPDLKPQAFQLNLDLRTGKVTVGAPAVSRGGPSLSLVGAEGLQLISWNGTTCAPIPRTTPQQKRCTFDLEVTNDFEDVDLLTPTEFPRPPQGTNGVLVFPLTATSDGSGGWAITSPDWDNDPVNFFNDFGVCSSGNKSDCYRYELIPSPFRADESHTLPRVGFDVPADANNVTAYIVVAANLRNNPIRRVEQSAESDLCGYVMEFGGFVFADPLILEISRTDFFFPSRGGARGFCSFINPLPSFAPIEIVRASLRFLPATFLHPIGFTPDFNVELVDYGSTLDAADYHLPSPPPGDIAVSRCCAFNHSISNVTALVQKVADRTQPTRWLQFRLVPTSDIQIDLWGPSWSTVQIVLEYRFR